ncbi:hypothetical protein G9464_12005 [Halostella sp. JP-L12]|uniref:hypothetical protein n=1 Tax=Halostella sp. JP-L12 TaxID=2716716 RepID=UPI00140C1A9E|nr:hypothetical protein [Halostella sp. JP-L12]NHN48316.1 hypothetical protein [Halostella sp. JP-L12]
MTIALPSRTAAPATSGAFTPAGYADPVVAGDGEAGRDGCVVVTRPRARSGTLAA